ncbi:MAG: hypothetical protein LBK70_00465 [Clostridiales bacterium]|nr:hypothetical protein [Clostridiales bacterium]
MKIRLTKKNKIRIAVWGSLIVIAMIGLGLFNHFRFRNAKEIEVYYSWANTSSTTYVSSGAHKVGYRSIGNRYQIRYWVGTGSDAETRKIEVPKDLVRIEF